MDFSTEEAKFVFKFLVTAIDVVDIGDYCFACGNECGDDHGRAGADVKAGNWHCFEFARADYYCLVGVEKFDMSTH